MKTIAYLVLVSPLAVLAAAAFLVAQAMGFISDEVMNAERVLRRLLWDDLTEGRRGDET
jgi:hypothetical protein